MATEREWLTRKEAAAYLTKIGCPISSRTLDNLARNNNEGNGPSFIRIGTGEWRRVRYRITDLDQWAYSHVEVIK